MMMALFSTVMLFSSEELKQVESYKTKEHLVNNFTKSIQGETNKKLSYLLVKSTKAHKDFLTKQVQSDPWKQLDKADHDKMMNALIEKELKRKKED